MDLSPNQPPPPLQSAFNKRELVKLLGDPFSIVGLVIYLLALVGLTVSATGVLWSALLLGFGVLVLSGLVSLLPLTRRSPPQPVEGTRPRAELWSMLAWYGAVILLAALTSSRGLELVNQFTNWFFLVIAPFILLCLVRGRALRGTWRSVGITRTGLKDALKLAILVAPLSIPLLYVVGAQQRAAIQMIIREPPQAAIAFLISFGLALLTVGFVEEFFFRGVLQSRLAAWAGSEWRGLLIASLLFGLFHLPMYFYSPFEPTYGNLTWALASVITEQAAMGILLGTLWARTHNLAAPILVHAFVDALAWMTVLNIGIR